MTKRHYEPIKTLEEMDEGMKYDIKIPKPDKESLKGVRIAILLAPGAEESEILIPLGFFEDSEAKVDIIAPDWTQQDWLPAVKFIKPTIKIPYQRKISQADVRDYDAVVVVGGAWNSLIVGNDEKMIQFIQKFAKKKQALIAAICQGVHVLIDSKLVEEREVTGSDGVLIDLKNAGADYKTHHHVMGDDRSGKPTLITSRNPNDLKYFCEAVALYFKTRELEVNYYEEWMSNAVIGQEYKTLFQLGIKEINNRR